MGIPGLPGDSPTEMAQWETSLDAYAGLVEALKSHTTEFNDALDKKGDEMDKRLMSIRLRLSMLAAKTQQTKSLTHNQLTNLKSLLKAAGMTSESVEYLNHVRTSDVREAERLQAVAIDEMVAKRKCEDCKNYAVASTSSWSILFTAALASAVMG